MYHIKIHSNQLSTSNRHASTTQYMSHGTSWPGSLPFRALYDAKTGKRKVATDLGIRV